MSIYDTALLFFTCLCVAIFLFSRYSKIYEIEISKKDTDYLTLFLNAGLLGFFAVNTLIYALRLLEILVERAVK